jgi:hypothetical protein
MPAAMRCNARMALAVLDERLSIVKSDDVDEDKMFADTAGPRRQANLSVP